MCADERNRRLDELIVYLDGASSAEEAARVEAALSASSEYRDELDALKSLYAGLDALGQAYATAAPHIDVVDAVLAEVAVLEAREAAFGYALDQLETEGASASRGGEWDEPELTLARRMIADLETLGERTEAAMPTVSLVDAVMQAIQPKVVSLEERRVADSRGWMRWGAMLAAAGIAIAAGLVSLRAWQQRPGGESNPPMIAQLPVDPVNGQGGHINPTEDPTVAVDGTNAGDIKQHRDKLDKILDSIKPDAGTFESTEEPGLVSPTMDSILAARRDRGSGGEGLARLRQWATLKTDDARAIVASGESSPEAIVAAAQSLKGEEKQQALLTAVGMMPQQPLARFELARTLAEDAPASTEVTGGMVPGGMAVQAKEELSSLKQLDQKNALPYYLEAKLLFEQGDVPGALQALEMAKQFDEASAYALEAAAANEQALLASGMDPESAKLIAALTGGMDEFNFLCDLGQDLLDYGRQFEQAGDMQTAQEIYEAVQEMGVQLEAGADFGQERLAGLDLQTAAVDVLEGLYTAFGSVEGLETLTTQTIDLVGKIDELTGFFAAFDELLFGNTDSEFWDMVSGFIVQAGDVNVFDYLNQLGLPIEVPQAPL